MPIQQKLTPTVLLFSDFAGRKGIVSTKNALYKAASLQKCFTLFNNFDVKLNLRQSCSNIMTKPPFGKPPVMNVDRSLIARKKGRK